MFVKSWYSDNSIRGQQLNNAFLAHEHRMVGSRIYTERYIAERAVVEYENIAIPDNIPTSFNGEITLATNHIERRQIKRWRYWLMEKTFEETWNKYKGEQDTKLIMDIPIKELTEQEYRAYKKVAWNEEVDKFRH